MERERMGLNSSIFSLHLHLTATSSRQMLWLEWPSGCTWQSSGSSGSFGSSGLHQRECVIDSTEVNVRPLQGR